MLALGKEDWLQCVEVLPALRWASETWGLRVLLPLQEVRIAAQVQMVEVCQSEKGLGVSEHWRIEVILAERASIL